MPHKNPWCNGTEEDHHHPYKMKHLRWVKKHPSWTDKYHRGEYWHRELICPKCGKVTTDIKIRTRRSLKKLKERTEK